MAHQRGGFKVNSPISAGAVKCLLARQMARPRRHGLFAIQTGQNSCNKISQNLVIA
jgi:hypothetical protein